MTQYRRVVSHFSREWDKNRFSGLGSVDSKVVVHRGGIAYIPYEIKLVIFFLRSFVGCQQSCHRNLWLRRRSWWFANVRCCRARSAFLGPVAPMPTTAAPPIRLVPNIAVIVPRFSTSACRPRPNMSFTGWLWRASGALELPDTAMDGKRSHAILAHIAECHKQAKARPATPTRFE